VVFNRFILHYRDKCLCAFFVHFTCTLLDALTFLSRYSAFLLHKAFNKRRAVNGSPSHHRRAGQYDSVWLGEDTPLTPGL
jgi:hypothetical protein